MNHCNKTQSPLRLEISISSLRKQNLLWTHFTSWGANQSKNRSTGETTAKPPQKENGFSGGNYRPLLSLSICYYPSYSWEHKREPAAQSGCKGVCQHSLQSVEEMAVTRGELVRALEGHQPNSGTVSTFLCSTLWPILGYVCACFWPTFEKQTLWGWGEVVGSFCEIYVDKPAFAW